MHGRRIFRLDADDADARIQLLDVDGDAGDESAAADGHEHGIEFARGLAQDFHADGALAGDDIRIIERMHEYQLTLAPYAKRVLIGRIEDIAVQDGLGAKFPDRLHLDRGRRARHDHDGGDAAMTRRQRQPLCMVAG